MNCAAPYHFRILDPLSNPCNERTNPVKMYDDNLRRMSAAAARAAKIARDNLFDPQAQLEAARTRREYRVELAARRLSDTLTDVELTDADRGRLVAAVAAA